MKKLILVHGWGGGPEGGWFDWLKENLDKKEWEVIAPQMPDTENPKIDAWISKLQEVAGDVDKNTYFIGGSIGCQAIMRYLEKLTKSKKVGGVIFVAGWFNLKETAYEEEEEKEIGRPWIETPIDFDKIKRHTDKFIGIFSDDDPCVPIADKKLFEERLGAKTIILKNRGHFDNTIEFPELLNKLLEISK